MRGGEEYNVVPLYLLGPLFPLDSGSSLLYECLLGIYLIAHSDKEVKDIIRFATCKSDHILNKYLQQNQNTLLSQEITSSVATLHSVNRKIFVTMTTNIIDIDTLIYFDKWQWEDEIVWKMKIRRPVYNRSVESTVPSAVRRGTRNRHRWEEGSKTFIISLEMAGPLWKSRNKVLKWLYSCYSKKAPFHLLFFMGTIRARLD